MLRGSGRRAKRAEAVLIYLDAARELALLALLVIAAYTDLASGKVYNWTTVPATLAGLMLGYALGGLGSLSQTLPSASALVAVPTGAGHSFCLLDSLLGIVLAGGVFGVFFLYGAFGAADVKLAVAVGALKGWYFALLAIVASALVGGVMALAVLVWKGQLRRGLRDSLVALVRPGRAAAKAKEAESPARLTVPYGFAISVGTLWVWLVRVGAF
jgi:prepilin peptidase CpaA